MANRREEQDYITAAQGKRQLTTVVTLPAKRLPVEALAIGIITGLYADTVSAPVDVFKTRAVHLYVEISTTAIGDIVSIVPEISGGSFVEGSLGQPTDTLWYPMGIRGATTLVSLPNDPNNYTADNFQSQSVGPLELRSTASTLGGELIRFVVPLDVEAAKFVRFRVAGISGTPRVGLLVAKSS